LLIFAFAPAYTTRRKIASLLIWLLLGTLAVFWGHTSSDQDRAGTASFATTSRLKRSGYNATTACPNWLAIASQFRASQLTTFLVDQKKNRILHSSYSTIQVCIVSFLILIFQIKIATQLSVMLFVSRIATAILTPLTLSDFL